MVISEIIILGIEKRNHDWQVWLVLIKVIFKVPLNAFHILIWMENIMFGLLIFIQMNSVVEYKRMGQKFIIPLIVKVFIEIEKTSLWIMRLHCRMVWNGLMTELCMVYYLKSEKDNFGGRMRCVVIVQ